MVLNHYLCPAGGWVGDRLLCAKGGGGSEEKRDTGVLADIMKTKPLPSFAPWKQPTLHTQ